MNNNGADDIIALTPSNVYDTQKMLFLLHSAKMNDFSIEVIGLNKPFTFLSKITLLKEYLEKLPKNSNPIICFTDAYDVFYIDSLNVIKDKFLSSGKDIIWSVEKWYSHQLKADKSFYEDLAAATNSQYKYINTGTYIGYKDSLLQLFTEIDNSIKDKVFLSELQKEGWNLSLDAVDQTIISHFIATNWQKYNMKLDYECDIYYIPTVDWDNINKYINNDYVNIITGKRSSIVHVPWKERYGHILIKLFEYKYTIKNVLDNKRYSWESYSIAFLKYGIMDAFGKGTYEQVDTHTFIANFGGKRHLLIFNSDYTKFTSTRFNDNSYVTGHIL